MVTSIVIYSILILLTFGIAAGYSLDSRRALGFRRFEPRWLAAVVGVILASLVIGAVTSLGTDAAEEQGLAPDRWEPGRRVSSRRQPSSSSSSSRSPKSSSSAASGSACSRSPGRSSRSQSLQSPSRSRTAYLALPTLLVLGGGLAWIRYRTAGVWPCFLGHATWNGLALALAAATSF